MIQRIFITKSNMNVKIHLAIVLFFGCDIFDSLQFHKNGDKTKNNNNDEDDKSNMRLHFIFLVSSCCIFSALFFSFWIKSSYSNCKCPYYDLSAIFISLVYHGQSELFFLWKLQCWKRIFVALYLFDLLLILLSFLPFFLS